jgi:thiol:disulfide interchange protein DsbA
MKYLSLTLLCTGLIAMGGVARGTDWVAGKNYDLLPQPQATSVPAGKVEVMEVFSYGCPACNSFRPTMKRLKASLPANAKLVYLPASWHEEEDWPMFQRAYLTAQSLGVADKAHEAMFDAIWTSGELGVLNPDNPRQLKQVLPSIEDAARFYQRVTGVNAATFIATSKSFGVSLKIRRADTQISTMRVPSTPTLVVNGKYLVNNNGLTGEQIIELVKFLVAKESKAIPTPAAPAKKPG